MTHLPQLMTHLPQLMTHLPQLMTHLCLMTHLPQPVGRLVTDTLKSAHSEPPSVLEQ